MSGDRVGMPAGMLLDHFGRWVAEAFSPDVANGSYPFLCGSALDTRDWHDVDVRLVLTDDAFDALFPAITRPYFRDTRWSLICTGISLVGKQMTGLPVDFQIQKESELAADRERGVHGGRCQPLGWIRPKVKESPADPPAPPAVAPTSAVEPPPSKPQTTTCLTCGKVASNAVGLAAHMRSHEPKPPCPQCLKPIHPLGLARHAKACPGSPPAPKRERAAPLEPRRQPAPPRETVAERRARVADAPAVAPHLQRTAVKATPAPAPPRIHGPLVGPVTEVLEELDDNDPRMRLVHEAREKRAAAQAEADRLRLEGGAVSASPRSIGKGEVLA